jgi:hypothetical protein
MKTKDYSCDVLCFPLSSREIESTVRKKSNTQSLLFVCLDLETVATCIKYNLSFLELKDLISVGEFNSLSLKKIFSDWRDGTERNEGDILETEYKYIFNYHTSHVLRAYNLAKLISQAIRGRIDYGSIDLYENNWPLAYSRSNIAALIRQLTSLIVEENQGNSSSLIIKLSWKKIYWSMILSQAKRLVLLEFFARSLKLRSIGNRLDLSSAGTMKRILFFSGGRDLRFHSRLTFFLKSYYSIGIKGSSKWNDIETPKNRFDMSIDLRPILFKGYYWNRRSLNKSFKYRNCIKLLNSLVESRSERLDDYNVLLAKYIGFRVERDIMLIKAYCGIIDKINPDLVFTSSLPLPLLSAKVCNRVTISEFEGIGIDLNPMAPYIGDYVSSPGPLSSSQLEIYNGGNGEILPVGAYYY